MRLRDKDNSTLALYFVYVAYKHVSKPYDNTGLMIRVFTAEGEEQDFHYDSEEVLREDLDTINEWILSREI